MQSKEHTTGIGTVVKLVKKSGLAYVQPDGSQSLLTFTFDKLDDYHGEDAEQLGLRDGSTVEFDFENNRIRSVKVRK